MGWALKQTVEPIAALITTADAKTHLRVDHSEDDALIDSIIAAAAARLEEEIHRQLVTATWRLTLDSWPYCNMIELPRPPLQAVTSIQYDRDDGTTGNVDATTYFVDTDSEPGRIVLKAGESWPTETLRPAAAVKVTYTAGYGDAASDVPEPLIQAAKILCGTGYEHRESVVVDTTASTLPQSAEWLLYPYRVWDF